MSLDDFQYQLQDTSCDDNGSDNDAAVTMAPDATKKATCSGKNGCGKEFPADEVGADFRFSLLCADCFVNVTPSSDSHTANSSDSHTAKHTGGGVEEFSADEENEGEAHSSDPHTAKHSSEGGGGEEYSADEEDEGEAHSSDPLTAKCSGENGCGEEYPADEVGADKLCEACVLAAKGGETKVSVWLLLNIVGGDGDGDGGVVCLALCLASY